MAGICLRYEDRANIDLMEFACDTIDEIDDAPTTTRGGIGCFEKYKNPAPMGSTLVVGNEGGDTQVYMLFSFGWKAI
jgi:hypothetical protein